MRASENVPVSANAPVLLYDGVCGFCNRTVRLLLRLDHRGELRFAALGSAYAGDVLTRHPELRGADSFVLVEPGNGVEHAYVRSDAVLRLASYAGGGWRLLLVLRIIPRPVRDACYDLFARFRYPLFGRYDRCPAPPPEARARFLDLP